MNILNRLCIACIELLRPLLGAASCKFSISCGRFALHILYKKPFFSALRAICIRLLRCNPWTKLQ